MPKLLWSQTHDAINLDVIDHRVYSRFVIFLNEQSLNQFTMSDLGFATLSEELKSSVGTLQQFFRDKLKSDAFDFNFDPTNQEDLNKLHRVLVTSQQQQPALVKILNKVQPGLLQRVNRAIHAVEQSTDNIRLTTTDPDYTIPLPTEGPGQFGIGLLRHGNFNIAFEHTNNGRSSFEKWVNGDSFSGLDTNNFNELHTTLKINTKPSVCYPEPLEYRQWCKENSIPCAGNVMPLANFLDLQSNLGHYRQLFYKNSVIENNFITFKE